MRDSSSYGPNTRQIVGHVTTRGDRPHDTRFGITDLSYYDRYRGCPCGAPATPDYEGHVIVLHRERYTGPSPYCVSWRMHFPRD